MTDERRITVKDVIDLLDYNREGRRNIRIIDSESIGDGSLIQTDSVLLEFLAKLPVDCLDAKGNVRCMMGKHDLTIFCYSTILTLTRNGISTFEELEAMSNTEIANIRGMGLRGYKEILTVLGRQTDDRSRSKADPD